MKMRNLPISVVRDVLIHENHISFSRDLFIHEDMKFREIARKRWPSFLSIGYWLVISIGRQSRRHSLYCNSTKGWADEPKIHHRVVLRVTCVTRLGVFVFWTFPSSFGFISSYLRRHLTLGLQSASSFGKHHRHRALALRLRSWIIETLDELCFGLFPLAWHFLGYQFIFMNWLL